MPIVKPYTSVIQPQPVAVQGVGEAPNADATGTNAAAAFGKAGQAMGQISAEMQKEALDYLDRKNKAAAKSAFLTYGDALRERQNGFMSMKRKDAVGISQQAKQVADKDLQSISDGLENDRQRELFSSLAGTHRASFLDSVASHEMKEIELWDKESSEGMIASGIDYASSNYGNQQAIDDAKVQIDVAVTTLMKGSSADTIDAVKKQKISDMHRAVIDRFSVDDAEGAKAYYEKNKEEIEGVYRDNVETSIKKLSAKQQSQVEADRITAAGSFDEQLAEARKIKDAEVRDATLDRVKARHVEVKKIEDEEKQRVSDNATKQILNAKTYEEALDIAGGVENGTEANKLRVIARDIFSKDDTISFPAKMVEAKRRIDSREITTVEQLYREYKPFASASDWARLEEYYRGGGAMGGLKDSTVRTIFKTLTGKSADEKPTEYERVWNYVINNLPKDRKPTDEEVKKHMVNAIMDGERQGGGWGYGEDMTYSEAVSKGMGSVWLPDVTKDEQDSILKNIKAWNKAHPGKPVGTDKTTIRKYKKQYIMGIK